MMYSEEKVQQMIADAMEDELWKIRDALLQRKADINRRLLANRTNDYWEPQEFSGLDRAVKILDSMYPDILGDSDEV